MLLHKENKTDNTTTELFSSHSVQGTEEYRPQHDLFMGERKGKERKGNFKFFFLIFFLTIDLNLEILILSEEPETDLSSLLMYSTSVY